MGPFFFHWYGWGQYLIGVLENGGLIDWVFLGVWGAETIMEQVFQISLLPKVFDWAENAEFLDNDVKKEEDEGESEGAEDDAEDEDANGDGDEGVADENADDE
mmetsp:Transcript_817/g.1228  ORF Transcript_817/g.1228 Transcript_817/m.1228 type:complete len:103 (-) Transcript_817:144-452(-)|eukprot:CAMPEP_0170451928 /NCGR_PEP_ID=MMETSP0123-20130129/1008_1 /TAXON_ID=182087 /ORGANISM="Favella ehrenbergii, Strain Fehren 1" /LENGTH=102 /DNA_ID=CAMNT_0010713787 /DNA_START=332 /DNA_END=640 /DNA_ORIENTATION=+